jgi:RimJ/RimL family protein N-acetyltransferase
MIFATSERLILRRPKPEDYESYVRGWSDPDMNRYTEPRANLGEFIARLIAEMQSKLPGEQGPNGPWYQYSIERLSDGAFIGDIGIGFGVPGERQVEIGYRILPEHQRRGHAREALAAVIPCLIEEHGIHRFVGVAASPNVASVKLLRSLGFRQEGHFKQSFLCQGEWLDDDYYALLASEWSG